MGYLVFLFRLYKCIFLSQFEMTWGWVNDDRIIIFRWTILLKCAQSLYERSAVHVGYCTVGKTLFPFLKGVYKSILPAALWSATVTWEADGKRIPQKAHRSSDIKALETTHSNIPASRLETCRPAPKAPGEERLPVLHHLYFTSIKSGTGRISDEEQMSAIPNEPLWKQDIPEPSAQWAVKSHIKKKPIGGRCGISASYQIQLPDCSRHFCRSIRKMSTQTRTKRPSLSVCRWSNNGENGEW